ncbi:hypothetical protein IMAU30044_01394 [Lactobacillus helveticus]|nr:hypothetical protein [Lactobacillus helveticus]
MTCPPKERINSKGTFVESESTIKSIVYVSESLNLSKFKTTDSTPPPTIFPTTIPTFTGLYSFGFMFPSVSAKSMSIICFSMLNTHY